MRVVRLGLAWCVVAVRCPVLRGLHGVLSPGWSVLELRALERPLRRVLLSLLAVVPVLLLVGVLPAGASSTNAAPWSSNLTPNSVGGIAGECNETMFDAGEGHSFTSGFYVETACQGEVPSTSLTGIVSVAPSIPSVKRSFVSSGAWSTFSYAPFGWFLAAYAQGGSAFESSAASCLAPVGGVGPDIWADNAANSYDCTSQDFQTSSYPTTLLNGSACSSGGLPTGCTFGAWGAESKVIDLTEGAAGLGSNGTSYKPFSIVTETAINPNPYCNGCGASLGDPMWQPPSPLLGTSACPSSMVSASNDALFNGVTPNSSGNTNQLGLVFETSGAVNDAFLKMDSLTCATGPPVGDDVPMPSTFFIGGSASGGVYTPCGLLTITGPVNGTTYQKGQSYAFTFDWSGGANEIVIDPGDDTPAAGDASLAIGNSATSGTSITVGNDSTVDPVSGASATVDFVPATASVTDPGFWCVDNGLAYWWYDTYAALNQAPPGTVQICYAPGMESPTTYAGVTTGCGGAYPAPGFNIDSCFASAGFDLYSPASWVLGALHDGQCIMEWLFVPSSASLTGFTNLFQVTSDMGGASTAGQWLGSLTNFATGFPAASVTSIQTAVDSGSCSLGPTYALDGHSFTICSALGAAGSSTSWSLVDSIVTATFLVLMGLALFHLMRRAVTGDSA